MLDIALIGADGPNLWKELKIAKINKDIPVVLFSAPYDQERALEESMTDAFLNKSFEIADGGILNLSTKHLCF